MVANKIRIMHIAQAAGGVDRYLRMLLKYLDKDKFENILVCSQDYERSNYEGYIVAFEQIEMRRTIGINDLTAAVKVRKIITKYAPDIVYAHSSKAGAIARLADINIKNVCIYNPHGWAFNIKGSKRNVYRRLEKIMAPFCDCIVCISDAEKLAAIENNICENKKLSVIYNGIDVEEEKRHSHKLKRADLGISEDAYVVGMVGRLSTQKAPDVFAKAAVMIKKKISNAHFIIVGSGEMYDKVKSIGKGISDSITITGWVDNPEDYINLFDVALLLSRWEGFGLVIPEYMLASKPIVATNVDAIPNLITDRVNGVLIKPDNEYEAAEAVMHIYNDAELREKIVQQGLKDVVKKYDVKRVAREHERLFIELVNRK